MSSAGCNAGYQLLAPFADRIVNHFLVRMVPFLLDMLAALPRPWSVDACTHALVLFPTLHSRRGSDPNKKDPGHHLSYQDCKPCTADCYPNNVQRCSTLLVASILLSTVLTPLNVQFLFGNILSILTFLLLHRASALLTFIVCLSSSEKGILRDV